MISLGITQWQVFPFKQFEAVVNVFYVVMILEFVSNFH